MRVLIRSLRAQADKSTDNAVPPAEVDATYRYWRRRILLSSLIGYALFYFVRTNISVALPAMMDDLGFTKSQFGLILTLAGVTYGISKFANGFLGDRANPRFFMAFGLLAAAAMNVSFGMSGSLVMLGTFWILNNWFQGMGFPPCARNMGYWFAPEERASTFGIWHTGHMIGAALVSVLTGWLLKTYGDWRLCFYVPAALAVFGAIFLLNRLRDTPGSLGLPPVEQWRADTLSKGGDTVVFHQGSPPAGDADGIAATTATTEAALAATGAGIEAADKLVDDAAPRERLDEPSYRELVVSNVLLSGPLWIISIANLFVYTLRYAGLHWGPTQLQEMKGISPFGSGWLLFGFEIAGMCSALAGGWLTDRYFGGRAGRVCVVATTVLIGVTFLFWRTPSAAIAGACFVLMGGLIYVPQMLIAALAMNLGTKRAAAAAVGMTGFFGYLSSVLSGVGLGYVVDHYGWDQAMIFLIGIIVLTTLLLAGTWHIGAHAPRSGSTK